MNLLRAVAERTSVLATSPSFGSSDLIAGVDTHADTHTLAILTATGGVVLTATFTADQCGYRELISALREAGSIAVVGVEGTNSYGAGLARDLTAAGYAVKEVLRPTRQVRRMHGKSDSIDAIEAARTVLAVHGTSDAKDSNTPAESLRCLLAARTQLIRSITALGNCIRSLLTTAPEEVRAKYRELPTPILIKRLAACRPGKQIDCPRTAVLNALKQQAQLCEDARNRADYLERQVLSILSVNYPQVLAVYGAGAVVAAQLVVTAGGNPNRIRDEAAFASLCGVAPIPASSGRTNRHRLNRGGDRRANSALHRIALVRMRHDERTREYVARRKREGKTTKEIMRCLKRAIAREAYRALTSEQAIPVKGEYEELKALREAKNISQSQAALALDTYPSRISDIENQRRPLPELTNRYRQWLEAA
jgi:transposase